jgi:hypothetical protein
MTKMKGFWRMVESIMAASLIVVFLLSLGINYTGGPIQPVIKIRGYEILENLERSGPLRYYASIMDADAISSEINMHGYNHTVMVCAMNGTCAGTYPDAENVWTSTYLIAGYDSFDPREVKLYVW